MITRERLKDLIAIARVAVEETKHRYDLLRRDNTIQTGVIWSALLDYSKAVTRHATLVDILTFNDKEVEYMATDVQTVNEFVKGEGK